MFTRENKLKRMDHVNKRLLNNREEIFTFVYMSQSKQLIESFPRTPPIKFFNQNKLVISIAGDKHQT